MENKSGLGLSSMSESTELMVGAAVLVVLIIVIYLIWKWYSKPAAPPAAATMTNRALTQRGSASTSSSDQVTFQDSSLSKQANYIGAHVYQHQHGVDMPRPRDMAGVGQEYDDLVTAGVFDPDMTVDQLDGMVAEARSGHKNQQLMSLHHDVNELSKSVAHLTQAVKQGNHSPAVHAAVNKVDNSAKVVKGNLANINH